MATWSAGIMESIWQQRLSCNSSSSPPTTGEGHTWLQSSFWSLKAIKHLLLALTPSCVLPEPQCQGIPKGKAYGLFSRLLKSSISWFKEIMECMFFLYKQHWLILKEGCCYATKLNFCSALDVPGKAYVSKLK